MTTFALVSFLIPPWYEAGESNLGSWGMVESSQAYFKWWHSPWFPSLNSSVVWGAKPWQLRNGEGSQAGFKCRHSPWFPSLNSSMVWRAGESNLGSWGMVRVLKQVLNDDIRPGFPSVNSSVVWGADESNLGSWGMVRVLKQVFKKNSPWFPFSWFLRGMRRVNQTLAAEEWWGFSSRF